MMSGGLLALVVIVAVFMLASSVSYATDRIEVPETFPDHPRLFLNQKEIDDLKAFAARESWLGDYVDELVAKSVEDAKDIPVPCPAGEDGEKQNTEVASQARSFALAYVLSGKQELAEAAATILRAYVVAYPTYEITMMKGRATSAALREGDWARGIACAYDLIYHSGALSEEDKRGIEEEVLRPCGEVMRICNHSFRSNWRNAVLSGMAAVGFCLGDRELLEETLNGIVGEDGELMRDGFAHHIAWSIMTDGVFYERSMGYHSFSQNNYAYIMEAARHSGVDLWHVQITGNRRDAGADVAHKFGETGKKTIKCMYDSLFYYVFGDHVGASVCNAHLPDVSWKWYYEAVWRAYGDEKFAWAINQREGGRVQNPEELLWITPDLPGGKYDLSEDATIGLTGQHTNACTLLPGGGYTVLRQDGSRNATGVLMTYGKYGSGHSHPDMLSIVLYAAGKRFAPETNFFGYGAPEFLTWNNQTISHNTVTVDEVAQAPQKDTDDPWMTDWDQPPVHGRPQMFHAGEKLKAFRADSVAVYEGVKLDRTLVLVDSVVLDFFRCRSQAEHKYDYALHIDAKLADCSAKLGEAEAEPWSARGYSHITGVRRAALAGGSAELTYRAEDCDTAMHLTFMPAGDMELIAATGILGLKEEQCEVLMLRATGKNVDFVVAASFPADSAKAVSVSRLDGLADGVLGVQIARANGTKDIILSAETAGTFEYAGQTVTGQVALLRVQSGGECELVDVAE